MKAQNFFIINLLGLLLISVWFFSSCGLVGVGNNIFGQDSGGVSNAGDGAVPKLRSRLEANPSLAGEDCEGNNSCEETCRDIYEERDNYKDCYNLSIGRVSELEDLFFDLLSGDSKKLKDIDDDHFEKYLEIGTSGFLDKLIPKIKRESHPYDRFKNILAWIVEEERAVVPVLKEEDQDNEILEALIMAHCDLDGNHKCQNTNIGIGALPVKGDLHCQLDIDWSNRQGGRGTLSLSHDPATARNTCSNSPAGRGHQYCPRSDNTPVPIPYAVRYEDAHVTSVSSRFITPGSNPPEGSRPSSNDIGTQPVILDYDNGNIYVCHAKTYDSSNDAPNMCSTSHHTLGTHPISASIPCTTLTHKKLGEVEENEKQLFVALAGAGEVFFEEAASRSKEEAFALGHALLSKACSEGSDTSRAQCKASFYCFLQGSGATTLDDGTGNWFNKSSVQDALLDEVVNLKGCAYANDDEFTDLNS